MKIKPVLAGSSPSDSVELSLEMTTTRTSSVAGAWLHSTTWPWRMRVGHFPVQVQSSPESTVHILNVMLRIWREKHVYVYAVSGRSGAMTSRKPLLPKNRDLGREGGKMAKKERYRFALLSKAALVEQVNMILQQVDMSMLHVSLMEEDLVSPSVSTCTGMYVYMYMYMYMYTCLHLALNSGFEDKPSVLRLFQ